MAALTASCIDLNIQGNGAYSVLKQLATMALQNGFITDSHQFLQTLLLREKMHSTGFASGVAVPHGKSACVKQPFVLFARKTQAIDWQASDGEDVNCWICLGVPQSGEEEQVKIIGTLCRKIIHQDFIDQDVYKRQALRFPMPTTVFASSGLITAKPAAVFQPILASNLAHRR